MKIPFRRIRHGTLFLFILILPVGVRVDGDKPGELTIEGHAGTGQLASVIRDCSGNAITSESSTFSDVAGAVQYSRRTDDGSFFVFGIRGGRFTIDYQGATTGEDPLDPVAWEFNYWNPHVAWETPEGGVGVGWLSDKPPLDFGEGERSIPLTGHIRFGRYDGAYVLVSFNENQPLVSGGGNAVLGLGYPTGSRAGMFTGFSLDPYDRAGFVHRMSWRLSDGFDLDLSGRAGKAGSEFEGSVSLGLRYHIPLGPSGSVNSYLEKRAREKAEKKETKYEHKEIG